MPVKYVPAKSLVTRMPKGGGWFGCDYNLNIYRGCCHGCIYCDSRSDCYHIENFDEVTAKRDALKIIRRELEFKYRPGIIGTGAMSDPYNPFERELELTRGSLELMARFGFGVNLITKSDLVTRDTDLLKRIGGQAPACVRITVTTLDDGLCKKLEPRAPVTSKRLEAVKALSAAGIFVGITLMPLLPFINDNIENVCGIVKAAHDCGARFVYPAFGVTLRQNQRLYFLEHVQSLFPGMKQRYIDAFGSDYVCNSPDISRLRAAFKKQCGGLGLLYRMDDIVAAVKAGKSDEQLTLEGF